MPRLITIEPLSRAGSITSAQSALRASLSIHCRPRGLPSSSSPVMKTVIWPVRPNGAHAKRVAPQAGRPSRPSCRGCQVHRPCRPRRGTGSRRAILGPGACRDGSAPEPDPGRSPCGGRPGGRRSVVLEMRSIVESERFEGLADDTWPTRSTPSFSREPLSTVT